MTQEQLQQAKTSFSLFIDALQRIIPVISKTGKYCYADDIPVQHWWIEGDVVKGVFHYYMDEGFAGMNEYDYECEFPVDYLTMSDEQLLSTIDAILADEAEEERRLEEQEAEEERKRQQAALAYYEQQAEAMRAKLNK